MREPPSRSGALSGEAHAHGKVILGGEHAVVYGCPALAAGIDRALWLRATPVPGDDALTLQVPAWGLDLRVPARRQDAQDQEDRLHRALRVLFEKAGADLAGVRIEGRTKLPAGAGLGSSAALCTALAKLLLGPGATADQLTELAMHGEQVFHGQPSGIDTELALHGGLLRFVRRKPSEPLHIASPLRMWIVSSGESRQSADLVQRVAQRFERHPELARPTWDLFEAQVERMQGAVLAHDLPALGEVMNMQHALLSSLGVSTPTLDRICDAATQAGALGAKLTGAGGGGCVLLLVPPEPRVDDMSDRLEQSLAKHLRPGLVNFPLEIPAT